MRLALVLTAAYLATVAWATDIPQDPYAVLGLSKRASGKDIKRAYKNLAKEWHPDKNDSPEAAEKFVAINKAYELLSDPLRKERYDKFGTFDDPPQHAHHRDPFAGFEHFFGGGFGGFGFESSESYFQKHRISIRLFSHTILERSNTQPFLLFAYSGYCQLCFHLQDVWKNVVEDLEPMGYGIGTVNAMSDGNLLEKLRVSRLPAIVAVVEGRAIHFRGAYHSLNARSVRVFARDVIPATFIQPIDTHDKLRRFVDQWKSTNKVSILIMGASPEPRLRYKLAAMRASPWARTAYAHAASDSSEMQALRDALGVKCTQCENILIFNDYPELGPVARLSISSANQLTAEALNALIDANKYLTLPKLISQSYLDEVCPVSSRSPRLLCALLPVTSLSSQEESSVNALRGFIKRNEKRLKQLNVRVAVVQADKQRDFIAPFLEKKPDGEKPGDPRDMLVFWRVEHVKARFSWLRAAWAGGRGQESDEVTDDERLLAALERVAEGSTKLEETAPVKNMADESAPSWFTRWARASMRLVEAAWFHLSKEEALPVVSALGTFLALLLVGYGLSYVNSTGKPKVGAAQKEKTRPAFTEDNQWHPDDPQTKPAKATTNAANSNRANRMWQVMEPLIHELRAESYFGLIRLLKPGCRSLIVLVDEPNKDALLRQFAQYIYPLRNNKTFSFGFLMVEKNLPWFRKLLEHTLPVREGSEEPEGAAEKKDNSKSMYEKLKSINPRQTVGTVLVLCGWKLYFSIYHPMHRSERKKPFLGFDSDGEDISDSDEEVSVIKEDMQTQSLRRSVGRNVSADNVLNGFPNWLDRLLEGSIRRYYIPEWPDNLH